jgi:hypothetical protein
MFRIYVPTQSAEDWKAHLAEPENHWRSGYSARTLASAWQTAQNDFPPEISRIFAQSTVEGFASAMPIVGIVEHVVPMPGKGYPSQIDLFVLAKAEAGLIAIAVEGKVSETFGPTLREWNTGSDNKGVRLAGIQQLIGLTSPPSPTVRYQLLHRTASAVSEAQRFDASFAVMLIHSFSRNDENFEDFRAFVELYGQQAASDELLMLTQINEIQLLTAWVHGDLRFLNA